MSDDMPRDRNQHYRPDQLDDMLRDTDSPQQIAELHHHVRAECDTSTRGAWTQILSPEIGDRAITDPDDIEL